LRDGDEDENENEDENGNGNGNGNDNTIAAINVSCYAGRFTADKMRSAFLPKPLETAQAIAAEMYLIQPS